MSTDHVATDPTGHATPEPARMAEIRSEVEASAEPYGFPPSRLDAGALAVENARLRERAAAATEAAEVKSERDDYAARLKATDKSWAAVAAERDEARDAAKDSALVARKARAALAEARQEAERLRGEVGKIADDMANETDDPRFGTYWDRLRAALASTGGGDTTTATP